MSKALGIINFAGKHVWVDGLQSSRPLGALSFLGRYRIIDFPISNMTNSGIDQIQVYVRRKPRSLVEHLGTGRHYNINSKRGKLQILFSENGGDNDVYNTDIAAYIENMKCIEESNCPYVVIAPSYMVYTEDYAELLKKHRESGADITLLYHSVDNAREAYFNCNVLELNKQKGVLSIEQNHGNAKNKNIFMDTYVMKRELFVELVKKAKKMSSMFTLTDIINTECKELDVRGVSHRGFFASITDFKAYYDANISLIDLKTAKHLFDKEWPVYTRTNDSCPTQYFETAKVRSSVVSNGCLVEGTVENSVIGRGCVVKKGAVVRNSVLLPGVVVGNDVHVENYVVDRGAKLIRGKEITAKMDNPGYVRRDDIL